MKSLLNRECQSKNLQTSKERLRNKSSSELSKYADLVKAAAYLLEYSALSAHNCGRAARAKVNRLHGDVYLAGHVLGVKEVSAHSGGGRRNTVDLPKIMVLGWRVYKVAEQSTPGP
ncbi:hypothetical protein J6590_003138 [Homalodisca vitripennis]|nr:hypothetical protein J6590_003138 [Homalodisca vitripennis]